MLRDIEGINRSRRESPLHVTAMRLGRRKTHRRWCRSFRQAFAGLGLHIYENLPVAEPEECCVRSDPMAPEFCSDTAHSPY